MGKPMTPNADTFPPPCPSPCETTERPGPGPCEARLHRYPLAHGSAHYGFYCVACDRYPRAKGAGPWLARAALNATDEQLEDLPWVPTAAFGLCAVCGVTGRLELHHLAPRNVFGEEADAWPTVRVCGECHAHWHRRMDGYRITAPRVHHG